MMPGESLASVAGCTDTSAAVPIFEELKRDQRVQSNSHESKYPEDMPCRYLKALPSPVGGFLFPNNIWLTMLSL